MKEQEPYKKIVLGVTGSLGTGKSTVAAFLKRYGALVIDADKIAHGLIMPGAPAYKAILRIFGRGILKKNGLIDRAALGRIVFGNKRLLKRLNACLHPRVIREIKKNILGARSRIVVIDAPLLLEVGLDKLTDKLIVVTCSRKTQLHRVNKKTGLCGAQIKARIKSQMPLPRKSERADFIIDNDRSLQETRKQLERIRRVVWKNLK